jgi:hypothetical protein
LGIDRGLGVVGFVANSVLTPAQLAGPQSLGLGSTCLDPIYSTRGASPCAWQEGGTNIPGTTNTFGGNSVTEYGPLLGLIYPTGPDSTGTFFEDFRRVLSSNPCPSTGQLPK